MAKRDTVVGTTFGLLGAYLIWEGSGFPEGVGRLPGPGFFPIVIGVAMLVFAGALLAGARRGTAAEGALVPQAGLVAATIVLTGVYLALWEAVPFVLRTPAYLAGLLLLFGVPWKAALAVSAALTAFVVAAFQYGLRLTLD